MNIKTVLTKTLCIFAAFSALQGACYLGERTFNFEAICGTNACFKVVYSATQTRCDMCTAGSVKSCVPYASPGTCNATIYHQTTPAACTGTCIKTCPNATDDPNSLGLVDIEDAVNVVMCSGSGQ